MPLNNDPKNSSSGNAFRHGLWQATIANQYGYDIAVEAGDVHDPRENSGATFFDSKADADTVAVLRNNIPGRTLGVTADSDATMIDLAKDVLEYQYQYGLFEAVEHEDGTFGIERVKITQEQLIEGLERLDQLDENSFEIPEAEEPEIEENPDPIVE